MAPARRPSLRSCSVRVVDYQLAASDGNEIYTFTLITTLLDLDTAPPGELAQLYDRVLVDRDSLRRVQI
jgi:hypothetical protein